MTNNDDIFKIIDDITEHLKTLTKEQRIAWFKKNMYIEPLSFTKEIDGTLYVVRTLFKEDAKENIAEKIQRIVLKKE
ncbi:MAG: transposon-encoded TnpW family protein [Clostridia bacterium]|nr:transposon-encoded TnpW family protein [Clostridia bacterium]